MRYCEELAKTIFTTSPTLATEDEILEAGFQATKTLLSPKDARALFSYNEDFPSDFIDEYKWLQGAL